MKKRITKLPVNLRILMSDLRAKSTEIYKIFILKLIRLYITFKTGNIKLWKKIQKEEEQNINNLILEMQDKHKISLLKKELEST